MFGITSLLEAYLIGLGTSFTPCVYPMIPVTLAIFGATAGTSRLRSLILAVFYVLGMACTYTVLGVLAARSGALFGAALGNPWVTLPISGLLIYLGLSCLDLVNIPGLHSIQSRSSRFGGIGLLGALSMGLVSGLVAAPCVTPSLGIILGKAAVAADATQGALLLAAYSLGMGTLFLFIALFPQVTKALPRSGNWLHAVKFVLAAAVIATGVLLALPFLGSTLQILLSNKALMLIFVILSIGIAQLAYRSDAAFAKVAAAFLFALPILSVLQPAASVNAQGALPGLGASAANNPGEMQWHNSLSTGLALAKERDQLILVDLFADWCTACKELDHITFADTQVQSALKSLVTVRLDFTDSATQENAALAEKYAIIGLPSLLFLKANGEEIPGTRITGFLGPKEFLSHLEMVRARLKPALALRNNPQR
jgi:thiol:disulfide interchange protein DsbD